MIGMATVSWLLHLVESSSASSLGLQSVLWFRERCVLALTHQQLQYLKSTVFIKPLKLLWFPKSLLWTVSLLSCSQFHFHNLVWSPLHSFWLICVNQNDSHFCCHCIVAFRVECCKMVLISILITNSKVMLLILTDILSWRGLDKFLMLCRSHSLPLLPSAQVL